jgi:hypothetical protein
MAAATTITQTITPTPAPIPIPTRLEKPTLSFGVSDCRDVSVNPELTRIVFDAFTVIVSANSEVKRSDSDTFNANLVPSKCLVPKQVGSRAPDDVTTQFIVAKIAPEEL